MNAKQLGSVILGACAFLMLPLSAGAGPILTTPAIIVTPDSFFDVTVGVDTETHTFLGYDIHLSVESAGNGMFALTGRSTPEPVDDPTPVGLPTHGSPDLLGLESDMYGATPNPFVAVPANSNLLLTTFEVYVLPSAFSGIYGISVTNWTLYWGDSTSMGGVTGPGISVTVQPIPEPGSLALLLLTVPSALLLRRRRR